MTKTRQTIIDDFLAYIQFERGYSNHTVIAYKNDLKQFMNFGGQYFSKQLDDYSVVDRKMIRHFLGHEYEQGRSAKTVSRRLATLKSFFKYLVHTRHIYFSSSCYISTLFC